MSSRYAPFLFPVERDGMLSIIEIEGDGAWGELKEIFEKEKTQRAFSFFEPTLQIEVLFHTACRSCRFPALMGSVFNVPATLQSIETVKPDTLVTTKDAIALIWNGWKKKHRDTPLPFQTIVLVGEESMTSHIDFEAVKVVYIQNPITQLL